MKWVLFVLLIFLNTINLLSDDFTIHLPGGQEIFNVKPRENITVILRVENLTNQTNELSPQIELPAGWKVLVPVQNIMLEGNKSELVFISIFIPQKALAGEYNVNIVIEDKRISLPVIVLEQPGVEVKLINEPEFVFAGDDYTAEFILLNTGNSPLRLSLKGKSSDNISFKMLGLGKDTVIPLNPGESKSVTVSVTTLDIFNEIINHRLQLIAQDEDNTEIIAEDASVVEIIPKISSTVDRFHKFPVRISSIQILEGIDVWEYDISTRLEGSGTLDEEGKYFLDFFINKDAGIDDRSFLNTPDDVYRATFLSSFLEIYLGDYSYSVSPLIENYRYGRGFQGNIILPFISFGGFYNYIFHATEHQKYTAGFVEFYLPDREDKDKKIYQLRANGFLHLGSDFLFGLYQRLEPIPDLQLILEIAAGKYFDEKLKGAYLGKIYGDHGFINYSLSIIYAPPGYPGNYRDIILLNSNLGFKLLKRSLKLFTAYNFSKSNLKMDPQLIYALLDQNLLLGIGYIIPSSRTDLSFTWQILFRKDKLSPPDYHDRDNIFQLKFKQPIHQFNLKANAGLRLEKDLLTGSTVYGHEYSLGFDFSLFNSLDLALDTLYEGKIDKSNINSHIIGWSCNLQYKTDRRQLYFILKNNYNLTSTVLSQVELFYEIGFSQKIYKNQSLTAIFSHNLYKFQDKYKNYISFSLEYHVDILIPVSRKKNIGTIEGFVVDQQTDEPVQDVILRIGNQSAVTDKKGYFVFPALSPGTHYLYIERASLDENYIPAMDMPLTLTVEEQKKQEVQINIVEGSSISGRIVLYKFIKEGQQFIIEEEEDDESKEEEELIEDSGIPNLIIEISQGDITKRRITDKDGEFDFKELTPGNWTLKCLSPLPFENHYYEKDSFEIILETGDHQVITINVKPKKRTIQMLDQEETLTVE